jgi:hypothetical protein
MFAKSRRTTQFFLTEIVISNFFYDVLPMDRIQTNYAVFFPRFKTNNEEFYKKNMEVILNIVRFTKRDNSD